MHLIKLGIEYGIGLLVVFTIFLIVFSPIMWAMGLFKEEYRSGEPGD